MAPRAQKTPKTPKVAPNPRKSATREDLVEGLDPVTGIPVVTRVPARGVDVICMTCLGDPSRGIAARLAVVARGTYMVTCGNCLTRTFHNSDESRDLCRAWQLLFRNKPELFAALQDEIRQHLDEVRLSQPVGAT